MTIAIFGNSHHEKIGFYLSQILDFLKDNENINFVIEDKLLTFPENEISHFGKRIKPHLCKDFTADFAISLGGDGTFLKTAQYIADSNIPIIGINIGRLGFLAETAETEIYATLQNIIDGKFCIEERSLLRLSVSANEKLERNFALNEIAITKKDEAMLNIAASINAEAVHNYLADGLLVSTPTGSTAYSLSVGGSIVVPQATVTLLSPIAPHSLNVRPLVIPDNWTIDLTVSSRNHVYMVAVDGRAHNLSDDVALHICKADFTIKLIRQSERSFFDTLRGKLMWGADRRN